MATERLPMRKIREILRLKWTAGRRHRQIARALGVGVGTVSEVVRGAAAAGLDWERVAALSDAELEAALYGRPRRALRTPLPDPAAMDLELKKPGVAARLSLTMPVVGSAEPGPRRVMVPCVASAISERRKRARFVGIGVAISARSLRVTLHVARRRASACRASTRSSNGRFSVPTI